MKTRIASLVLCLFAALPLVLCGSAKAWQPAKGPLMTRWAKDVTPDKALPEYPRPQMVREEWQNLNGLWDYAIVAKDAAAADAVGRRDPGAVPGRVGAVRRDEAASARSSGSGIAARSRCPARWKGKRVLLHFGAVDWEATVLGQRQGTRHAPRRLRRLQLRHHRRAEARRRAGDRRGGLGSDRRRPPSRAASRCASPAASGTPPPPASGRRCGWSRWRQAHIESLRITPDIDDSSVTVAGCTPSVTGGKPDGQGRSARRPDRWCSRRRRSR